ncbi:5061_t:CDS:2 [Funneliformis geosporum]|uniref:3577_t:CDS:1 n=1 Tax=Funneliformis geosporum TaxID=1117311 RepID=A0A9W4SBN4_9GLOM|nr:5061_t:CDS:2 [Funneliformis geosporum]CAI2162717.1 3577_t:CDS:2 [Funneliformis geosporum]
MEKRTSTDVTCENEVDEISTFQNNDFNVITKPQFNNDIVGTHKNLQNSQCIDHQPFATTQPTITSLYNSLKTTCATIYPELLEGEETPKMENGDAGSSSSSSGEYVNEGLELWNRRREMWIKGNIDNSGPSSNRNNPALANITPNNYHSIYDSLVHEKKKLAKPVPLPYVIKILVSGWKRDGVLPSDHPSGHPSGPNNQHTPY